MGANRRTSQSLTHFVSMFVVRSSIAHPYFQILCHSFFQGKACFLRISIVSKMPTILLCVCGEAGGLECKTFCNKAYASKIITMTSSGNSFIISITIELDLLSNYLINFSAVDCTTAKNYWPFR